MDTFCVRGCPASSNSSDRTRATSRPWLRPRWNRANNSRRRWADLSSQRSGGPKSLQGAQGETPPHCKSWESADKALDEAHPEFTEGLELAGKPLEGAVFLCPGARLARERCHPHQRSPFPHPLEGGICFMGVGGGVGFPSSRDDIHRARHVADHIGAS